VKACILILFVLGIACFPTQLFAQRETNVQALGFRFGSNFNRFYQPEKNTPLINGTFSTVVLGAFFKQYYTNGMFEIGANFVIKEPDGGLTFPVVMENFRQDENTGLTAVEGQFMVGPRLWYFYPKFGFIASYMVHRTGFYSNNEPELPLSQWNLSIPIGFSFEFPTSFGSTGFGGFYNVGLSRMIDDRSFEHGGRLRSWNVELHVAFRLGTQSR